MARTVRELGSKKAKGKGIREGAHKYTETGWNADSMQSGANSWKKGSTPKYARGLKISEKSRKAVRDQHQSWANSQNSQLDAKHGPRSTSLNSKNPMRGPRP